MITAKIVCLLFSCVLVLPTIAGCSGDNAENALASTDSQKQPLQTEHTEVDSEGIPDDVPTEFPILDDARNVTATKMGQGANKGDRFYSIRFNVDGSIQETGKRYRQILKDKGLDIVNQDLQSSGAETYKVNTDSYEVTLTILFTEETTVWINYTKR